MMQEEETQSTEETPEEQPAAEEQPASEPEAAEEAAADAPEAAPAEEASAEPAAEPAEVLSPKQRRKQARSRTPGPARPERSPTARAGERVEQRARKAAARSRWRAKRREKRHAGRGPAGEAAAAAPREDAGAEPGKRKVRQGVVVSSKGDKTITVRIDAVRRHRVYGKVVRESNTLHAHDETNQAGEGDLVRVMECRPLSRTKRWRLVDVLEKAR